MDDEHRPDRRLGQVAHLDLARAAAELDDGAVKLIRLGEQRLLRPEDRPLGRRRVGHVEELDLPDHYRRLRLGGETGGARQLRGEGAGRDDARLLDDHRDRQLAPIDDEVDRQAEGQRVAAHDILDEMVGNLHRQRLDERREVALAQPGEVAEAAAALLDGELVETLEGRVGHGTLLGSG